ncbi:hypothetical protein DASB73_020630 [Starmerella bacillaris]|uniref:DUF2423 domain-containing protein n=1 Tax=Starmerella bacillaris TaxID=1247836 RepID=A0AAV5RIA0_STABA|nr:hypothetical protein DASB73_020630 [Starmerella bacillaris]
MAKSLRASRNKVNKTLKRQSVFGEAAAAREQRLAAKLHQQAIEQALEEKLKEKSTPETNDDQMETQSSISLHKKRKLAQLAKKHKKEKRRRHK